MRWCETLPPVDPDQRVLLDRNVELEEARFLHVYLRTPEHAWWDALTHSLPYVHLPGVHGVVFRMKHAGPSCKRETHPQTIKSFTTTPIKFYQD